jgi:hypothetical protein
MTHGATSDTTLMGMVPMTVSTDDEKVLFVQAGRSRFAEPFYDDALGRMARSTPAARIAVTFDELRAAVGEAKPAPKAAVFHTGRCGSTLLMRMFGHDRTTLVVSEPSIVANLLMDALIRPDMSQRCLQATADVLVVLDRFAASRRQRPIIKLPSWVAAVAPRFLDLVPEVPLVFVHRPVGEVIASELHEAPGWVDWITTIASAMPGWPATVSADPETPAPLEERLAATWAAEVAAVLALPQPVCFVEHADLVARPADVLERIAAHVGLEASWSRERARSELNFYAKSSNPAETFDPSGRHAREPLAADVEHRIRTIVGDLPTTLAERSSAAEN